MLPAHCSICCCSDVARVHRLCAFKLLRYCGGWGAHVIARTQACVRRARALESFSRTYPHTHLSLARVPPLQARTKDGLVATLDVSFNFKLIAEIDKVSRLYLEFGEMDEVRTAYNRIARNWVRVVAARYTAREFFFNRTQIQGDMLITLDEQLQEAYGQVDSLQFLQLALPTRVEDAQNRQVTAQQEVDEANNERDVAIIEARTTVLRAAEEAKVIVLEAQATAREIEANTEASIEALRQRYRAEASSYKNLAASLNLDPDQLLSYIWMDAVGQGAGDGSVINVPPPSVVGNAPYLTS